MSYIWVCRCCAGQPEAVCASRSVPGFWDCSCRTETLSGCRQPWGLPAPPVNRSLAGTVAFLPRAALPRPEAAGLTWLFEFELKSIKSKIRTLSLTVTATFLGLRSCMWLVASVWGCGHSITQRRVVAGAARSPSGETLPGCHTAPGCGDPFLHWPPGWALLGAQGSGLCPWSCVPLFFLPDKHKHFTTGGVLRAPTLRRSCCDFLTLRRTVNKCFTPSGTGALGEGATCDCACDRWGEEKL